MSNSGLSAHDKLATWLSWQETAHSKAWDFGLERCGEVWRRLGSPRLADHIITVAGTNGKGSCVRWLEQLCITHGKPVASFTSPHLLDYRERIRFDGQWVEEQALIKAFVAIDQARADISLSYFEWSALAAFWLMTNRKLSLAVLEVGLGGRLDATNIIDAEAVIITKIGLDHTQWLGETIEAIAAEKAAVMREGQWVVFADHNPPSALYDHVNKLALKPHVLGDTFTIEQHENAFDLTLSQVGADNREFEYKNLPRPKFMLGQHQLGQFAACVCAFRNFYPVSRTNLVTVLQQTSHPARLMTVIFKRRPWLLDVAHNADSAEVLSSYLHDSYKEQKVPVIIGMLEDKDAKAVFLQLDKHVSCWYLISLDGVRGGEQTWLAEQATAAGISIDKLLMCDTMAQAIPTLIRDNPQSMPAVVMGSFITVASALKLMDIRL